MRPGFGASPVIDRLSNNMMVNLTVEDCRFLLVCGLLQVDMST